MKPIPPAILPFNMTGLFSAGSSPDQNADALRVMLEALVAIDSIYLRYHPNTPLLASPEFGVVYGRTNDWLNIPAMKERGHADCKSLTAMRVAQHRRAGRVAMPVFRFRQNRFGGTDYHILVQTGVNRFEDPSKELGMCDNEWSYFKS